ncbi:MAG: hypothetical protein QGH93_09275 [Gammaproteobacteria bacterium]|jgi:hypothetical protein|nr:hypothetical protein [Chromatiales bacterium]MDP6675019.1 hypothetical protein [Gammaproteobacteria bacterium]
MSEQRKKTGRLQLLMLAAVFFGPALLAWLLYNPGGGTPPVGSTANGELITTVKLVPDANLQVPREQQNSPYPGRWTLVHVGDGACNEPCAISLYETRQVRQALGKDDQRVQRILFLLDDTPLNAAIVEQHPGLIVFPSDHLLASAFIAAIEPYSIQDVFLIDPLGNLIMRFTTDIGMKGMHKDLKKLLKISHIG